MVFSTIGNREVLQLELATLFLYILDWIDNIQVDPIFSAELLFGFCIFGTYEKRSLQKNLDKIFCCGTKTNKCSSPPKNTKHEAFRAHALQYRTSLAQAKQYQTFCASGPE